jgi:hypothetical protein
MRENRPYGSEGGESGSTGLPYPYRFAADDQRFTDGNTWTLWFPANAPKVLFATNKDATIGNGGSGLHRLV